jgi:hypothetical protein
MLGSGHASYVRKRPSLAVRVAASVACRKMNNGFSSVELVKFSRNRRFERYKRMYQSLDEA